VSDLLRPVPAGAFEHLPAPQRRPLEVAQLDLVVDRGHDGTEALLERNAVVQAVRGLPRRQREVVVLRFFLDLSVAQAAAVLGASEGTVKSYTARAIARLRDLLSEEPPAAAAVPIGGSEC